MDKVLGLKSQMLLLQWSPASKSDDGTFTTVVTYGDEEQGNESNNEEQLAQGRAASCNAVSFDEDVVVDFYIDGPLCMDIFEVQAGGCGNGSYLVSLNGNFVTNLQKFNNDCATTFCSTPTPLNNVEIDPSWYIFGGKNSWKLTPEDSSKTTCYSFLSFTYFEIDCPSESPSVSGSPSLVPSDIPSTQPSWQDDEQCKKKDPENDICAELDGHCKVDCEDDEDFVCVPDLCSYDRHWDKPTKSPKMRKLTEEEIDVVDIEVTTDGSMERKLKANKAPKATKSPKSSCECKVPRKRGCKK